MVSRNAPEAGRSGLPQSLYWRSRSSLQGGNPWVGGRGVGRRWRGNRPRFGGGSRARTDRDDFVRDAPANLLTPVRLGSARSVGAEAGFSVCECPNIAILLYSSQGFL